MIKIENRQTVNIINNERQPLLSDISVTQEVKYEEDGIVTNYHVETKSNMIDNMNVTIRRVLGAGLAFLSGLLYAFTFTPTLYTQDNYPNASQNALDYIFSLYTGIFISSVCYFAIYCVIKQNKPQIYQNIILPGLISGIISYY